MGTIGIHPCEACSVKINATEKQKRNYETVDRTWQTTFSSLETRQEDVFDYKQKETNTDWSTVSQVSSRRASV